MGKSKISGLEVNYSGAMAPVLGKSGISIKQLKSYGKIARRAVEKLISQRRSGQIGFADLPYDRKNALKIKRFAQTLRGKFDSMVVIGIGGSALGTSALIDCLKPPFHSSMSGSAREGWLSVIVADNISPEFMRGILGKIPLARTIFNVVTKSGSTSETLSVFSIVKEIMRKSFGADWRRRFVITTDSESGFLRGFAEKNKLASFSVPSNVGGRFSVFSSVGLLPAASAGINIEKLLAGAASMDKVCFNKDFLKNPAAVYAAIHHILYKKGRKINVLMPYWESLKTVSSWFAQLWAESLGKRKDIRGRDVFVGPTPVKAKGVTDQHSQLQLYAEGPSDKVVTFISVDRFKDIKIPKISDFVFGGKTLGQLLKAEEYGTKFSLLNAERPFISIRIPEIKEFFIGQLLYFFEVSTAIYGELLGINTFNQPGVEFGKKIAKEILRGGNLVSRRIRKLEDKRFCV